MARVRISIFWKLYLTIISSMVLSSFLIGILYLGIAPRTEIHPHFKEALVRDAERIAADLSRRLKSSPESMHDILADIYETEDANLRVFDAKGNLLASSIEDRLKETPPVSFTDHPAGDESTCRITYRHRLVVPAVSVPIVLTNGGRGFLEVYFPFIKGIKNIMPRGLPEIVSICILGGLTAFFSRLLTRPLRELTRVAREMTDGNFGARVDIMSDDEVGQLSKSFNNVSQRLAELQDSRRELFADISHELRSPLARILTDAEILIDREMPTAERDQHLKAICSDINNMSRLIGDLSILAQPDQNQLDISLKRASLQDVISQAVSLFLLQIEEKGISLKQSLSADIGPVMIDPQRIGQVVSNLLMNAMHYTPAGGTIEIGLRNTGTMAEVWVKDTGEGIPEEKLPFIFERFYRVDESRSRQTGGSGLGLAIARKFVASHGGQIRAESTVGKGTCITFSLPQTF